MDYNQIIGNNLKKHRKKLGFSQQELSSYLGISSERVNSYEKGKNTMPTIILSRAAKLFGIYEADFYEPGSKINEIVGKWPDEGKFDDLIKMI